MSFWDSIGSVAKGLIEIGPLKIDNDTVEKVVGAGAVLIAGYATYKVLSDKGAAENVATMAGRTSTAAVPSIEAPSFGLEKRSGMAVTEIDDMFNFDRKATPEMERSRQELLSRWQLEIDRAQKS